MIRPRPPPTHDKQKAKEARAAVEKVAVRDAAKDDNDDAYLVLCV